ncbi:MAG TPA: thioredoxin domain-containing protein [Candidatus Paceibacterota bacterium]|nr:thioredoxin domain-containing protein [Candidatus Paceibacterota bacterium]
MDTNNGALNKYLVPISVVLAGLFIGGAVMWNGSHPAGTGTTDGAAMKVNIKDVKTSGLPYVGNANAPVTMAFWSDFQCPYCKAVEVGGIPQIPITPAIPEVMKNYVETGKVKIVFKDFSFLGPNSDTAALYGRAVWELYPSQYMMWRTAMYVAQDGENTGFGDEASVQKLTKTIAGIDEAKVTAAVKANQATYMAAIAADRAEATKFGVNATPSFIVGTQVIAGAQPYANFQAAIDPLLK